VLRAEKDGTDRQYRRTEHSSMGLQERYSGGLSGREYRAAHKKVGAVVTNQFSDARLVKVKEAQQYYQATHTAGTRRHLTTGVTPGVQVLLSGDVAARMIRFYLVWQKKNAQKTGAPGSIRFEKVEALKPLN